MRRLLLAAPAILLSLFYGYPLALVLAHALDGSAAWRWLADDYMRSRLELAFTQAGWSVLLVLLLAVPVAWLHHARRIPGSRALLAVQAAPFVLPAFVVAFAIREVLGPGGWLAAATGLDFMGLAGPMGAVVAANAYYNTGMAARLVHAALEARPRRLEEAAATLGAAPQAVWRRVTLPLLAPPLAAAALLTFLFSFSSFGVVLYLGEGRVDTLETVLYQNLSGAFPREDRAAVLALSQMAIQTAVLAAYFLLIRRAARLPAAVPREAPRAGALATAAAVLAAAAAVLPAAAVLAGGFRVAGEWSLLPWRTLLDPDAPGHLAGFAVPRAIGWSLAYAGAAAVAAVALTLALAFGARGRWRRIAEAVAALPLGTSSLVIGFGFLLAFTGDTFLPLIGRPLGVVAAHTLVAFPFTARVLLPALDGLDARLEDAAATLGSGPWGRLLRVQLPLLRGPLAVAAGFAAALSLGDFGASLLLMTDDVMGLSVWVLRHGGPGSFNPLARAQSTALAGLLMAVTFAVLALAGSVRPHRRPR